MFREPSLEIASSPLPTSAAAATPLVQLVYTSRAVQRLQAADLQRLVEAADKNNWRDEITGALLYHHGQFIEVLEGSREDVSACFARIARDTRHRGCTLLALRHIECRAFGAWSLKILPWSPAIESDVDAIFEYVNDGHLGRLVTAIEIMQRLTQRSCAAQAIKRVPSAPLPPGPPRAKRTASRSDACSSVLRPSRSAGSLT